MKRICKLVLFMAIFSFIYSNVSLLLIRKGNGYGTDVLNFYQQDRNSIDILVLGSSHAYAGFSPQTLYDNTKMKAYDFATQQQPIWITYYYLVEALKYQNPKYIILETHMAVVGDYEYASESVTRDAIDRMKMSINKIDAINNSVELISDRYSYYFNIAKYHSRYKELTDNDYNAVFSRKTVENNGYIGLESGNYKFSYNISEIEEIEPFYGKTKDYLLKIIELTKRKNIKLILVKTPCVYDETQIKKLNYIKEIADKENITFLNYVKNIEDLNLEYDKDFYDTGHLCKSGSEKLSAEVSKIINNMEANND